MAAIDCDKCHQVMYNLETGKPEKHRGQPMKRPKGVPPPCRRCPKGGPDKFSTLIPQNAEAVEHYLECSATGSFPKDQLVARHAGLLRQVEQEVERMKRREEMGELMIRQTAAQLRGIQGSMPF